MLRSLFVYYVSCCTYSGGARARSRPRTYAGDRAWRWAHDFTRGMAGCSPEIVSVFRSTYFNCIMFMVASSVVLTVVVLNYHHRTPTTHTMPNWVSGALGQATRDTDARHMPRWIKCVLLQWLPWLLRMNRPGKKITRKTIMMNNKMRELELKERSSRSLLANEGAPLLAPHSSFCFQNTRELQNILRELRFITNQMRSNEDDTEIRHDWKFAAMVVDRFCLITFTLYTVISSVVVLLSAPHIVTN
ncbi:nicotinic acetylcholine receptor subunit alpha 6 isoform 3a8a [Penaeus vannamei]|uniref:Nicotinic acetylcholine receptor subunit alpha 6 isoform 3a8a n=1 Tax=Penaeus vannamei TaxID=6689 RepID=A0A3R7SUI2_PENVA|nr:nicotinic acetylcholine receptor subunit alpha 6 isoform 3a8a [Penaeus vannamei]